jgi:hypothetical protein
MASHLGPPLPDLPHPIAAGLLNLSFDFGKLLLCQFFGCVGNAQPTLVCVDEPSGMTSFCLLDQPRASIRCDLAAAALHAFMHVR